MTVSARPRLWNSQEVNDDYDRPGAAAADADRLSRVSPSPAVGQPPASARQSSDRRVQKNMLLGCLLVKSDSDLAVSLVR